MTVIEKEQVINAAQEAAENAYVPYSKFRVGAALITKKWRNLSRLQYRKCLFWIDQLCRKNGYI